MSKPKGHHDKARRGQRKDKPPPAKRKPPVEPLDPASESGRRVAAEWGAIYAQARRRIARQQQTDTA